MSSMLITLLALSTSATAGPDVALFAGDATLHHDARSGELMVKGDVLLSSCWLGDSPIDPAITPKGDSPIDPAIDTVGDSPIDPAIDVLADSPIDPAIDSPIDPAIDSPIDPAIDSPIDPAIDCAEELFVLIGDGQGLPRWGVLGQLTTHDTHGVALKASGLHVFGPGTPDAPVPALVQKAQQVEAVDLYTVTDSDLQAIWGTDGTAIWGTNGTSMSKDLGVVHVLVGEQGVAVWTPSAIEGLHASFGNLGIHTEVIRTGDTLHAENPSLEKLLKAGMTDSGVEVVHTEMYGAQGSVDDVCAVMGCR